MIKYMSRILMVAALVSAASLARQEPVLWVAVICWAIVIVADP